MDWLFAGVLLLGLWELATLRRVRDVDVHVIGDDTSLPDTP